MKNTAPCSLKIPPDSENGRIRFETKVANSKFDRKAPIVESEITDLPSHSTKTEYLTEPPLVCKAAANENAEMLVKLTFETEAEELNQLRQPSAV
jgi:hypothetical protein